MHHLFAVVSIAAALVCWQVPEFMQQYYQRLGGAIDELTIVVRDFDNVAQRSGRDRSTALETMSKNPEQLVRDLASNVKAHVRRLDVLTSQQALLADGATFASAIGFAFGYDQLLFDKTFTSYAWAMPLTKSGIVFAMIGWVLSYLSLLVIWHLLMHRRRAMA